MQRANGLEDALLSWAEERGRQRAVLASNEAARVLRYSTLDTQTEATGAAGTARFQHRAPLLSHAARSERTDRSGASCPPIWRCASTRPKRAGPN